MNFLQLACNVPKVLTARACNYTVSAICVLWASAHIEALPNAGHAYGEKTCRGHTQNGLVQGRSDWQAICIAGSV